MRCLRTPRVFVVPQVLHVGRRFNSDDTKNFFSRMRHEMWAEVRPDAELARQLPAQAKLEWFVSATPRSVPTRVPSLGVSSWLHNSVQSFQDHAGVKGVMKLFADDQPMQEYDLRGPYRSSRRPSKLHRTDKPVNKERHVRRPTREKESAWPLKRPREGALATAYEVSKGKDSEHGKATRRLNNHLQWREDVFLHDLETAIVPRFYKALWEPDTASLERMCSLYCWQTAVKPVLDEMIAGSINGNELLFVDRPRIACVELKNNSPATFFTPDMQREEEAVRQMYRERTKQLPFDDYEFSIQEEVEENDEFKFPHMTVHTFVQYIHCRKDTEGRIVSGNPTQPRQLSGILGFRPDDDGDFIVSSAYFTHPEGIAGV